MGRKHRSARIRRLATLFVALGDPESEAIAAASRLARRVPDGPRGERMAIIERRERVPEASRSHEAWVLRRVMGWTERDAAKALDCSRTVLCRHLEDRSVDEEEEQRRIARCWTRIHGLADADAWKRPDAQGERPYRVLLGFVGLGLVVTVLAAVVAAWG